jgi:ABC-2 type transport system ATP-binding protein
MLGLSERVGTLAEGRSGDGLPHSTPIGEVVVGARELTKRFPLRVRDEGQLAALRQLFRPRRVEVEAISNLTFTIRQGEIVGLLGLNGAGKTTTLKCLSGLLHPTAGFVEVLGERPSQRRRDFLRRLSFVMGSRNQLLWDVPAFETFRLSRAIYQLDEREFRDSVDELTALLDLAPILHKPVRKLSLGQRMRCELANAMLHRPALIFLDEPTLGLDILAQSAIREFILDYRARHNATVILTSHYMEDVTSLVSRVLLLVEGQLAYDGPLTSLVQLIPRSRRLRITLKRPVDAHDLAEFGRTESYAGNAAVIRIEATDTPRIVAEALARLPIRDLEVLDESMENVLRAVLGRCETI